MDLDGTDVSCGVLLSGSVKNANGISGDAFVSTIDFGRRQGAESLAGIDGA